MPKTKQKQTFSHEILKSILCPGSVKGQDLSFVVVVVVVAVQSSVLTSGLISHRSSIGPIALPALGRSRLGLKNSFMTLIGFEPKTF